MKQAEHSLLEKVEISPLSKLLAEEESEKKPPKTVLDTLETLDGILPYAS